MVEKINTLSDKSAAAIAAAAEEGTIPPVDSSKVVTEINSYDRVVLGARSLVAGGQGHWVYAGSSKSPRGGADDPSWQYPEMPTYKPGDIVRIELDLHDESGVASANAMFVLEHGSGGEREIVTLRGDGGGETDTAVVISGRIGENVLGGEYRCQEVWTKDSLGNSNRHRHDIRFQIDSPVYDIEGPSLSGWRFVE